MEINAISPDSSSSISRLIWTVNLCSISASTLSYIYLSWYIYSSTGSLFLSQAVLFTPMILPVIFVNGIKRVAECTSPGKLLLMTNIIACACTFITFFFLPRLPLIALAGGLVIGSIDALQRVGRIVAIKYYFSSDKIESTVPLTLTAQFIAGGLAGGLMALFRNHMTVHVAMSVIAGLFIVAFIAAALLPPVIMKKRADSEKGSAHRLQVFLSNNPGLKHAFIRFVAFITFFQGFFNISRVTLPSHVLGLAEGYVGLLQVVNSVSALIGAVLYYIANKRGVSFNPFWMSVLSATFMCISATGVSIAISYISFFFYIFFFELAFFKLQSDIVKNTSTENMSAVASMQYAGVYGGMILSIFTGSIITSYTSLFVTATVFAIIYFGTEQYLSKR